jgi:hypothetical protein
LSLGIGATLTQTSLDKSKLRFNDQYDYRALLMYPTLENLKPYPTAFTANAGALYTRHTENSFIPMQQILNAKCKLSFGDYPEVAGNFKVMKGTNSLKKISFNYPRTESDLTQISTANFENFTKINNISTVVSIDINVNKTGKIIFEDINNFSEEDIYSNISYTYNKEMKVYEALGEKYTLYLYIIKEL